MADYESCVRRHIEDWRNAERAVRANGNLTTGERLVILAIADLLDELKGMQSANHAGYTLIRILAIQNRAGVSKSTVERTIRMLVNAGLIERKHRSWRDPEEDEDRTDLLLRQPPSIPGFLRRCAETEAPRKC